MNTRKKSTTSHLKRRLLILAASALYVCILALIAVNISSTPVAKPKTLNVLNWTSYIPADVIKNFETEYGIDVNYGTYSSNEELLAKISSSTPGTYDLIFPSDYMVSLLQKRDLLEPLDQSRLTNLGNLNPRFLAQPYDEKNQYSLPFLLATTVIAYNSDKVSEISSYQDLLRPEFKNNLILLDDERIVIGALLEAIGYDMNDTDADHLSQALDFYHKLKPNVKAFDSDSPKTFFITDEVDAGLIWNAEATLATTDNPAIKSVYPEEGFALSMDNYAIVKNAKNQANAYLFIDYLLREDVASQIVAAYPYISPVSGASKITDQELDQIFSGGEYIENVDRDATRRLDHLWAKIK